MGISQATTAVMVFLAGLLPASCHKSPPPAKTPTTVATTNVAGIKILSRNLGELSMTNQSDLFVQFDNGEICTLTPKLLAKGDVCITLAVETRNELGETHNFNVKQVTAKAGAPVEVAVGDLSLSFTPKVIKDKSNN